jgi:hypothetical protein
MNLNKLYYIEKYSKDQWEREYNKIHYSIMDAIVDSANRVAKSGIVPDDFTILMSPEQIKAYRRALGGSNKIKVRK